MLGRGHHYDGISRVLGQLMDHGCQSEGGLSSAGRRDDEKITTVRRGELIESLFLPGSQ